MANDRLDAHYAHPDIAGKILAALRASAGTDVAITPDALAVMDHFHGRGLVATREMAALLDPQAGEHILDIGSGIGGPARWLAAKFGCRVTGVDLTQAFCDAAMELNEACGMADQVRILHGSATSLPLAEATFDRAYSQNVVMNIADKAAMYREAFRVLKPGGVLVLSNITAGAGGPPHFPVPWASTPDQSFLATNEETRGDLLAAGFAIEVFADTRDANLPVQIATRRKLEADGPPTLGLHVWQGDAIITRLINSIRSTEDDRTRAIEVKARKPG